MRDFSSEYQSKKTTAAELAARVQSGWLVGMDAAASHTPFIMAEIEKRSCSEHVVADKPFAAKKSQNL